MPERYFFVPLRISESATWRYLAAIRELVRVRKLQATVPPVQVNTQVNVLRGLRCHCITALLSNGGPACESGGLCAVVRAI
jgi:hypothetical protein